MLFSYVYRKTFLHDNSATQPKNVLASIYLYTQLLTACLESFIFCLKLNPEFSTCTIRVDTKLKMYLAAY